MVTRPRLPSQLLRPKPSKTDLHPLAVGAVITVLVFRDGRMVVEGIARILRPASGRPHFYAVQFSTGRCGARLIYPATQANVDDLTRAINGLVRDGWEPMAAPLGGSADAG